MESCGYPDKDGIFQETLVDGVTRFAMMISRTSMSPEGDEIYSVLL